MEHMQRYLVTWYEDSKQRKAYLRFVSEDKSTAYFLDDADRNIQMDESDNFTAKRV